jgi:hypothetical protein
MPFNETTQADQLLDLANKFDKEADELEADQEAITERLDLKRRLADDLRQEANAAVGRLFPARPVTRKSDKPGTSDAIIAVLTSSVTPMTGTEVFQELERRGWLPLDANSPRNAVRASLWTLGRNGKIHSLGDTPASRRWAAKTSSQSPYAPDGGGP